MIKWLTLGFILGLSCPVYAFSYDELAIIDILETRIKTLEKEILSIDDYMEKITKQINENIERSNRVSNRYDDSLKTLSYQIQILNNKCNK